jgi:hypothetical protein
VPDSISTIWVDATFIPAEDALLGTNDNYVEYNTFPAENIGTYSVPVVFTLKEASLDSSVDTVAEFTGGEPIEYYFDIPAIYFVYEPPLHDLHTDINVEIFQQTISYSGVKNIPVIYTTGYYSISGSLNKKVAFTVGKENIAVEEVPVDFKCYSTASGAVDKRINYTNFSGNVGPSGIPIPFYYGQEDYWVEYFNRSNFSAGDTTSGSIDRIVDISFAGWVPHNLYGDVYCALEGYKFGLETEVTVSAGGLCPLYMETYSANLTTSGITIDVICSLVDMAKLPFEAEVIPGRIDYLSPDIYSTVEVKKGLTMDVGLFSIKFDNFFLDIGEHNDATAFVSVDILDDICPISVSGTYFLVDDQRVSVTLSGIDGGYRMFYDPIDDFESLMGTTIFTAHAENECGNVLEQDYYLTFGYLVEYINEGKMDYGFDNKILVRIAAEDYASCPSLSSLAWDFESKGYHNADLSASIVGRVHVMDSLDMSAEIQPISTAYFYGKEFRVVVNAKDFAGNEMEPLVLIYKIENKP